MHYTDPRHRLSLFWPMLLLEVALLAWFSFQHRQLAREQDNLLATRSGQEAQFRTAEKTRQGIDALALGLYREAKQGNPNAKSLVDSLARRGVTINPPKDSSPPKE
jgi:hypothetical protein